MKLIIIGSGKGVHLCFESPYVSNYHAEMLLLDNGDILLTDKGSKNGTYLNNQRLQPNKDVPIKRGDNVRFADQMLDWSQIPSLLPDLTVVKEIRGIGTNFRNKYQLQGEKVSRFHATLTRKSDKKWYIQDHSTNGTSVNGQLIPSNRDILLKRGDRILCAGVEVPNPYGKGSNFDYRRVLVACSVLLLLMAVVWGVFRLLPSSKTVPKMTDEEIYNKYKNSTVLLLGFYYYQVSAGNLDLEKTCGLPTAVVIRNGKLRSVDSDKSSMISYTGTGFFISEDGKIVTNLHIVRPWLFEKELSIVADQYKMYIANAAVEIPALNAYTSQVEVKGVLAYIGMIPNGAYFSDENLKQCREVAAYDDTNKDVAIIQLDSKQLPDKNTCIVPMSDAVVNDADIRVGAHIYTMGFPFGLNLQDLKSAKGMQILANGGSITQECTDYSFGFNAPSYGGASGSPVFNDKGQLIGVLNSGVSKSQGFNYAIKAVHVKNLLENSLPVK